MWLVYMFVFGLMLGVTSGMMDTPQHAVSMIGLSICIAVIAECVARVLYEKWQWRQLYKALG